MGGVEEPLRRLPSSVFGPPEADWRQGCVGAFGRRVPVSGVAGGGRRREVCETGKLQVWQWAPCPWGSQNWTRLGSPSSCQSWADGCRGWRGGLTLQHTWSCRQRKPPGESQEHDSEGVGVRVAGWASEAAVALRPCRGPWLAQVWLTFEELKTKQNKYSPPPTCVRASFPPRNHKTL